MILIMINHNDGNNTNRNIKTHDNNKWIPFGDHPFEFERYREN